VSIPVYSARFIAVQGLVGTETYTVPPGYVAVVRQVNLYNGGGISVTTAIWHGSVGQTLALWASSLTASDAFFVGAQVFYAGETFDITTNGAWDATVSGYLLTTP
jgi:hypothetical protein